MGNPVVLYNSRRETATKQNKAKTNTKNAGVAQLVEQLICNQQVGGSSPSTSSKRGLLNAVLKYGRIPEWPKGADCKSVVSDFGGSNPPSPTIKWLQKRCSPRNPRFYRGFRRFYGRKNSKRFCRCEKDTFPFLK